MKGSQRGPIKGASGGFSSLTGGRCGRFGNEKGLLEGSEPLGSRKLPRVGPS